MLRFLRRRREPAALCPVCGRMELAAGPGDWRCGTCGSRIPTGAYLAFMRRMLDLIDPDPTRLPRS